MKHPLRDEVEIRRDPISNFVTGLGVRLEGGWRLSIEMIDETEIGMFVDRNDGNVECVFSSLV